MMVCKYACTLPSWTGSRLYWTVVIVFVRKYTWARRMRSDMGAILDYGPGSWYNSGATRWTCFYWKVLTPKFVCGLPGMTRVGVGGWRVGVGWESSWSLVDSHQFPMKINACSECVKGVHTQFYYFSWVERFIIYGCAICHCGLSYSVSCTVSYNVSCSVSYSLFCSHMRVVSTGSPFALEDASPFTDVWIALRTSNESAMSQGRIHVYTYHQMECVQAKVSAWHLKPGLKCISGLQCPGITSANNALVMCIPRGWPGFPKEVVKKSARNYYKTTHPSYAN